MPIEKGIKYEVVNVTEDSKGVYQVSISYSDENDLSVREFRKAGNITWSLPRILILKSGHKKASKMKRGDVLTSSSWVTAVAVNGNSRKQYNLDTTSMGSVYETLKDMKALKGLK
ncbi:MAG: hypothetical protein QGI29_01530 [Pirellulales bacterium]|nr:hypothetical protein [Pirellulales bacterium]